MIDRGRTSAPYAFVIPRGQRHAAEAADMVNLFRAQGAEVHVATADFSLAPARKAGARAGSDTVAPARRSTDTTSTTVPSSNAPVQVHAGDWIVRLDQPYAATPRTLLAIQHFKADDPPPYDDTGWTLDELRHVQTLKIADSTILSKPMQLLTTDAKVEGTIPDGSGPFLVRHLGDWRSAVLPWKVAPASVSVAEESFTVRGEKYPAGTYVISNLSDATRNAIKSLGLNVVAVGGSLTARQHPIRLPRVALMHSWLETQNEGWVRYAFDQMGVPYTYISDQSLRTPGRLDKFDVVVFPHVSGSANSLVNGRPMVGPPIPWKSRR
jgi:hypothetical protein